MFNVDDFARHLAQSEMSGNTIRSYRYAVSSYFSRFPLLNSSNLAEWRSELTKRSAPATVNLRINALNSYIKFSKSELPKITCTKIQHKTYVEKVISHYDYIFFKKRLAADGRMMLHFAVWTMCASGARISELLKVQVEDFEHGHFEVSSKGGKIRRIYFPRQLCDCVLNWLSSIGRTSGHVFLNRYGKVISARGLSREIKQCAYAYGIKPEVVHPHAFRHRFAINFLSRNNDLPLLADLMGHSSIETTRIYLRRSVEEQRRFLDSVVDW